MDIAVVYQYMDLMMQQQGPYLPTILKNIFWL